MWVWAIENDRWSRYKYMAVSVEGISSRPLAQIKCSQISTAESLLCDKVQAFRLSARYKVVFI